MTDAARADDPAAEREALLQLMLAEEGIELAGAAIGRPSSTEPAVLSYAQERMWFLHQFEDDTAALGIHGIMALHGVLDVPALRRSLDEVFRRHDVLRTVIVADEGQPRPVTLTVGPMPFREIDVGGDQSALEAALAVEAVRTFDIEREPPIMVTLARVADDHHVLSVVMHHIASDGSSFEVFFRELTAIYGAFVADAPSPLDELDAQYQDYARWQRTDAVGVFERQLNYWREQLSGPLPTFEIPPDFSRPPRHTFDGATVSIRLPPDVSARLEDLCKHTGSTMFMALLAGFEVVVSRHAGERDVVIGTPVAGRVRSELEPMIGVFLNTVVLRQDLSDRPTFRTLLGRVRDTSVEAFANQDVPFELLLADLQPARDMSRTPLFQIFFNMTHLGEGGDGFAELGLRTEVLEPPVLNAKFDLTMYVNESSDGIDMRLVYNRGLYDPEHMERLVDQYVYLLEQAVADPDRMVDDYELVHKGEIAATPNPSDPLDRTWRGSVPAAIREAALTAADRVAVIDRTNGWTYGVLAAQMARLATWLRLGRVGGGDIVAIYGHRSGSLVYAIAGVLASGAAYVLLDPAYPPARLAALLRIAKPTVWLSLDAAGPPPAEVQAALDDLGVEHRSSLPDTADVAALESLLGVSAADVDEVLHDVGPDDPACLTFTSGSTGQPKAVIGRHGSLTHFFPWMSDEFDVGQDDRFSMLSGLSHDPLQRDIFWPLFIGATLVVPDPSQMGTAGYLAQWMRDEKISVAHFTPAMSQLATETVVDGAHTDVSVDSLRVAFFIGEALTRGHVVRLSTLAPNVRVVNLYGTTETQRASGYHLLGAEGSRPLGVRPKEIVPLGKGMPGAQLLVRTDQGRRAAIGEIGNLVMRSPHLALGYLDDDEATSGKFMRDPHGESAHDQLYLTGDRGRYTPEGAVEFLGRNDHQVQLRGFRIELGEVEAALRAQPGVSDAVVDLRADDPDQAQLVAYIVVESADEIQPGDLIGAMRLSLPAHMVPSRVVLLDRLPLTPNGKVDRKSLPVPTRTVLGSKSVSPKDELERELVEIWCEVLGRSDIGVNQDFFALGGYSLLATRVLARVGDRTGARMAVSVLFEHPTIAELASAIRDGRWRQSVPREIVSVDRGQPVPASSAQERLLFMDRFVPGSRVYNLPLVLRLSGDLDEVAMRWSLEMLLRRHESLRTNFEFNGECWNQIVVGADRAEMRWAIEDVDSWDAMLDRVHAAVAEPFDLSVETKWRALLVRLGDRERVLAITMHHIAVDGWSIRRLLVELVELYRSHVEGRAPLLPSLPLQYLDYASWEHEQLISESTDEGLAYWVSQLSGELPVLDLPGDRARLGVQSHRGGTVHTDVATELLDRVRSAARAAGVTPFNFLLAGYVATLARWSGQDDFVIGTATANRARPEFDGVVGMFVNTLPLRTRVDMDAPFSALLDGTKRTVLGALAHEDVPFDRIVEAINPARDLSRSIVFQTMFVLNNLPVPEGLDLSGIEVEPIAISGGSIEQDVVVTVVELADRAHIRVEFNADVFDASTIERLMDHWKRLVESAVVDSSISVGSLAMISDTERVVVLSEFASPVDPPAGADGVRRLEDAVGLRVLATPDAIAFEHRGESMTFAAWDTAANRLARRLITAGVRPGGRVGIAVDRSLEMVVAVLGVLKAGAAYVPLDPGLPADRLAFMIADSEVLAVLVSSPALGDQVDLSAVTVVDVVQEADAIEALDGAPISVDTASMGGGGAAWVIYTSGSTGTPKGVEVEHASAVNFVFAMADEPGVVAKDVWLAVPTLSFDPSVMDLFVPTVVGARVVIADRDDVVDARRLESLIDSSQATVMQATPTTWTMLLEAGWQGSPGLKALCGGEAMPVELARRLRGVCASVWNLYGPTETTVWSTSHEVTAASLERVNVPIGKPIAGMVYRVLDSREGLLPVGVPGEVFIGGVGVARGYVNRADLTVERFVSDPFDPAGRLYRTGDLARWLPDGSLEFLGRSDFQVKLRGNRIELGEIEAALRNVPDVADAVVVATGEGTAMRLIAYLVGHDTVASVPVADLRTALRNRLPEYMVPSEFVWLDEFPLTTSRKIDRNALPAPRTGGSGGRDSRGDDVGPHDSLERMLVDIWQKVLDRKQISIHDDFFALGGYSLLATRMVALVEDRTGTRLPVSVLFQHPTIAELAVAIRDGGWQTEWTSLVPIQPAGTGQPFFYVAPYMISVLELAPLGDELGLDRPLYGIQPQGLDGLLPPHTSVEDMAAHYIAELKTVQPEGPYAIGGHCAGSWVAFEIARQLEAEGAEISTLAIVDQGPPGVDRPAIKPIRYVASRIGFYARGGRLRSVLAWQFKILIARVLLRRVGPETARFEESVKEAHREAHRKYEGGRIRQDISLILSADTVAMSDKAWYTRWCEVTDGNVTIFNVAGTHANLLVRPFVNELAVLIATALHVGDGPRIAGDP